MAWPNQKDAPHPQPASHPDNAMRHVSGWMQGRSLYMYQDRNNSTFRAQAYILAPSVVERLFFLNLDSNSAVMLREKPFSRRAASTTPRLSHYPLFISAGSINSLSQYSKKLLNWLKKAEAESEADLLPSVAFHLADRGNHQLPHVVATTVTSIRGLETKLEEVTGGSGTILSTSAASQPVVLVIGGQESDFIGVSGGAYWCSANTSTLLTGFLFRPDWRASSPPCLSPGRRAIW